MVMGYNYCGVKKATTYLQLVILLLLLFNCSVIKCCIDEERLALLKIKDYMLSYADPEYNNSRYVYPSWSLEGDDCCQWSDEVRCDVSTGHVTELVLGYKVRRYFDIEKTLKHPWFFNVTLFRPFSQLVSLDLTSNGINGLVEHNGSTKISTLKNLRVLKLDINYNIGTGLISVGDLTSLRTLSLSDVNLNESSFPLLYQELANLRKLQILDLSYNLFSGNIQGFCKLKSLLELNLVGSQFSGSLPSCLQNLSSLQTLDLSHNHFSGKFPKMLSSLGRLEYLDLTYNNFEGKLYLSSLNNLSNLHTLKLSKNMLEVQIGDASFPPTFQLQTLHLEGCNLNKSFETFLKFLSHQTNLSDLTLSNNSLTGGFPIPYLTNLPLQHLDISNNHFHGKLHVNIGRVFPNIEVFNLSTNHFEGPVPTSMAQIRNIRYLDLTNNNFSGKLPGKLLSDCYLLVVLELSNNRLEGDAIPEDMNLPYLEWLNLSKNRFRGTIKESLRKSTKLYYLDISSNNVTGRLPLWIGNFSDDLLSLSVSQNNLKEQIPKEICKIIYLDLSQNNFNGHIPSCSSYCSLSYMNLNGNNLTGEMPKSLSNCTSLQTLDLSDNQLSGNIPLWIDKLSSLAILLLAGNHLHGSIPHQLCQLRDINILNLSYNNLEGDIPICFGNMSFGMKLSLNIASNSIFSMGYRHGDHDEELSLTSLPHEVKLVAKNNQLSYKGKNILLMSELDLSCNNLIGNIPPPLGDLKYIQSLNLSHNCLSGSIPTQLSNLQQVGSLDLSYNNLNGTLPSQLVELTFLEIFNVSYNNLFGRVPQTGQFANFDELNYLGNPRLYGYQLSGFHHPIKALPPVTDTNETEGDGDYGGIDIVEFLWSFSMSCVVMFLATNVVLFINPQWRAAWFQFVDWRILWWFPRHIY